jgi:hypothetical protein
MLPPQLPPIKPWTGKPHPYVAARTPQEALDRFLRLALAGDYNAAAEYYDTSLLLGGRVVKAWIGAGPREAQIAGIRLQSLGKGVSWKASFSRGRSPQWLDVTVVATSPKARQLVNPREPGGPRFEFTMVPQKGGSWKVGPWITT